MALGKLDTAMGANAGLGTLFLPGKEKVIASWLGIDGPSKMDIYRDNVANASDEELQREYDIQRQNTTNSEELYNETEAAKTTQHWAGITYSQPRGGDSWLYGKELDRHTSGLSRIQILEREAEKRGLTYTEKEYSAGGLYDQADSIWHVEKSGLQRLVEVGSFLAEPAIDMIRPINPITGNVMTGRSATTQLADALAQDKDGLVGGAVRAADWYRIFNGDDPFTSLGKLSQGLYDTMEKMIAKAELEAQGGTDTTGGAQDGTGEILNTGTEDDETTDSTKTENGTTEEIGKTKAEIKKQVQEERDWLKEVAAAGLDAFDIFGVIVTQGLKAAKDLVKQQLEAQSEDDNDEDKQTGDNQDTTEETILVTTLGTPDDEEDGKYKDRTFGDDDDTESSTGGTGTSTSTSTGGQSTTDNGGDTTEETGGTGGSTGGTSTNGTAGTGETDNTEETGSTDTGDEENDGDDKMSTWLEDVLKEAGKTAAKALSTTAATILDAELKNALGHGTTMGEMGRDQLMAQYPGTGSFDHTPGSAGTSSSMPISNNIMETILAGKYNLAASRPDATPEQLQQLYDLILTGPEGEARDKQVTAKVAAETAQAEAQAAHTTQLKTRSKELLPLEKDNLKAETKAKLNQANLLLWQGNTEKWLATVKGALLDTDIRKGQYGSVITIIENNAERFYDWIQQREGAIELTLSDPSSITSLMQEFAIYILEDKKRTNIKTPSTRQ